MQINRMFEIIYLLLNRQSVTAGELARQFEVSRRTIYRDVELLSSAGIPIYMTKGRGGGISLLPGFVLNKAMLTQDEKTGILSALRAVDAVSLEQTDTAISKLSSLFGNADVDWVEVDFSDWENGDEEAALFAELKSAIIGKHRVAFDYHGNGSTSRRQVEPMKLCFKGQSWYLHAYCTLREDYRCFKLRRIKVVEVLPDRFDRQAPARVFENAKPFSDDLVSLTLKLSKAMAYRVYDEFSKYEVLPDGDFLVNCTMPRGDWVYYYIATFGEHCEVTEPEDMRLHVKERLQRTLEQYL